MLPPTLPMGSVTWPTEGTFSAFLCRVRRLLMSGTVYTAPESVGTLPDTPVGPTRIVPSDDWGSFIVEDFSSFNTSEFRFSRFLSFVLKDVFDVCVISQGSFVNKR